MTISEIYYFNKVNIDLPFIEKHNENERYYINKVYIDLPIIEKHNDLPITWITTDV